MEAVTAVGYGHAEGLARIVAREAADGTPTDPPGPTSEARPTAPPWAELYDRPDVRTILTTHDIASLFRVLKDDAGLSYRRIAALIGVVQSEVSSILAGRRVTSYAMLLRIATGLGIPRGLMRLGDSTCGGEGSYGGGATVAGASGGVSAEMLRRHVLALGPIAALGTPIRGLGELLSIGGLLDLNGPAPEQRPSRLLGVHVAQVRDLTHSLRRAVHTYGANPQMSSAATAWADHLLGVPGHEVTKVALVAAVAELHTVAGWAGSDAGFLGRAMFHYGRALELATEAGDAYLKTVALAGAGMAMVEHDHADDGLKMLQLGAVKSWDIAPDHDRRDVVEACVLADSVPALVVLGEPEAAYTELARSRQVWTPARTDPWGDPDGVGARLELDRGRLDAAEPFAAASVRRWEGVSERGRTLSAIVLATIYVRASEPRGLQLAYDAITAAGRLTSVRARKQLEPLVKALASRRGGDYRDLARRAYHVSTTRV